LSTPEEEYEADEVEAFRIAKELGAKPLLIWRHLDRFRDRKGLTLTAVWNALQDEWAYEEELFRLAEVLDVRTWDLYTGFLELKGKTGDELVETWRRIQAHEASPEAAVEQTLKDSHHLLGAENRSLADATWQLWLDTRAAGKARE
jgi:hypothetical protein